MQMKKAYVILLSLLMFVSISACSGEKKEDVETKSDIISFEAYIKEGETFEFELDPNEVISYEEIINNESHETLSLSNWDSYFEFKEVYREHLEYDDEGNVTDTFMKGTFYTVALLDKYYFVDNWSRNGLEYQIYIDGYETRTMTNEGIIYDPITTEYKEVRNYYGAEPMLIMKDFVNSWDEITVEEYSGELNECRMESISNSNGDIFLLNASAVEFKKYKDDIWYFAAYGAPDEYFVLFIQTDDLEPDPYKEYEGAVYVTSGYRENQRYTGYDRIVIHEILTDLLKYVNE